jgi:hypothetical protein
MGEKLLESKLRREVKKMGGMAIKFVSPGHAGVADRIVIMPGGLIWFVELKSEGKKLSPLQKIFKTQMEDLKCRYWLVDCPEMLAECLHEIEYITKIKNSR